MTQAPAKQLKPSQPWWPAVVAVLAMCGLYLCLPESLTFGPSWLLLVVVFVLMVPAVIAIEAVIAVLHLSFFGLLGLPIFLAIAVFVMVWRNAGPSEKRWS